MVTIGNNKQVGLDCAGTVQGTAVFATDNTGGDVASACKVNPRTALGPSCGAE